MAKRDRQRKKSSVFPRLMAEASPIESPGEFSKAPRASFAEISSLRDNLRTLVRAASGLGGACLIGMIDEALELAS